MWTVPFVNLGGDVAPTLVHHLNLFSITGLPNRTDAPRMSFLGMKEDDYHRLKEDKFEGVQSHLMLNPSPKKAARAGLQLTAAGIVMPHQLLSKAKKWKSQGYLCATIMIVTGNESLQEALDIADLTLTVSKKVDLPVYLELHRGTVTQDIDIVLGMIEHFPGLKFNADFSHYITAYRWCETFNEGQLSKLEPILCRIGYVHLRPSNSSHIQLTELRGVERKLYTLLLSETFKAFKKVANSGDVIIVAPELLPRITGYAMTESGILGHLEIGDRYQFSKDLSKFAQSIFYDEPDCEFSIKKSYCEIRNKDIIISVRSKTEIEYIDAERLPEARFIRVRLGEAVSMSPSTRASLVNTFMDLRKKDSRYILDVARNTLTHDVNRTVRLQKEFGPIPLYLNLDEWVIGQEYSIDKLKVLKKKIQHLEGVQHFGDLRATAEHYYRTDAKYGLLASLSPFIIIERFFNRFYKMVQGKILNGGGLGTFRPNITLIATAHVS